MFQIVRLMVFNFLLIKIHICCFRWLILERTCSVTDNVLVAGCIAHATPTNEVYLPVAEYYTTYLSPQPTMSWVYESFYV